MVAEEIVIGQGLPVSECLPTEKYNYLVKNTMAVPINKGKADVIMYDVVLD